LSFLIWRYSISRWDNWPATFRALYLRLCVFREDLMEHIHLKNNVLFDGAAGSNWNGLPNSRTKRVHCLMRRLGFDPRRMARQKARKDHTLKSQSKPVSERASWRRIPQTKAPARISRNFKLCWFLNFGYEPA